MLSRFLLFILFVVTSPLMGFSTPAVLDELVKKGIEVHLKNPVYESGALTTTDGGVITGPNIRIQARHIILLADPQSKDAPRLFASGDLIVQYCDYAFTGCEIYYDFEEKEGYLLQGTFAKEPWFIAAERIHLLSDGSYCFEEGHVTTSQNANPEWAIKVDKGYLTSKRYFTGYDTTFRLWDFPVFWMPWFKADLNTFLDHPIRYRVRWGGKQGFRIGFIYELYSWQQLKVFTRFDYRFGRGPGGAIESDYISNDRKEWFFTKSYVARDSSILDEQQRFRYRFQGVFGYRSQDCKTQIDLTYDKLSDKEMATDYYEKDLELKTGKKTQFNIRHVEPWGITNVFTRVKINSFQTVKQELPSVNFSPYPWISSPSNVIVENQFRVGYLDFQYAKYNPEVEHYHAARAFWIPHLFKPITCRFFTLTPGISGTGVFYSNSQDGEYQWLAIGSFEADLRSRVSSFYGCLKHTIEPYTTYTYYSYPTVNANDHYIFDILDGWAQLHLMRFGVRNLLYNNATTFFPSRRLTIDTWANIFFDTPTIGYLIPKGYTRLLWDTTLSMRQQVEFGWDFQHHQLDHINYRLDWTLNEDFAMSLEYRHRSSYDWRKVDHNNFFLDSFRTIQSLRDSALSDRRDTFLFETFFRFHTNWALRFQIRNGWYRLTEPAYNEYSIDLLTTIRSIWHAKISFQRTTEEVRLAVYFSMESDKPSCCPFL